MQTKWRKVGAVLGSALMIGATLAGAAFAQDDGNDTDDGGDDDTVVVPTKDLGDYKELMIPNGAIDGLFVLGGNAATADVVSAMGMVGYVANQETSGTGGGSGAISLTPETASVEGVKRHVEIEKHANESYEFATATSMDTIGPEGVGSTDGIVTFLYSYRDKGALYLNSTENYWEEKININTSRIEARQDDSNLVSEVGDQYDEIVLDVGAEALQYEYDMKPTTVALSSLRGNKIYFMGKEYTVISATDSTIKLGASDAEVVLTTANPTTTIGGVDVTLGGIYSASSNTYKAKVTITSGGTTETKFITSGSTQTCAGIEVYVKDAVVTTTGTNEGEAQMVVGAGILKLDDGDYLKRGDDTETSWRVEIGTHNSGANLNYLRLVESQSHSSWTGDWPVLHAGEAITSPNDLFLIKYNGLTDQYGNPVNYRTLYIQPDSRAVHTTNSTLYRTVRIRTPDGDYLTFDTASGVRYDDEVWVNTTGGNFVYKDTSSGSTTYTAVDGNVSFEAKVGTHYNIGWFAINETDFSLFSAGTEPLSPSANMVGVLRITEPALSEDATANSFNLELSHTDFANETDAVGDTTAATYLSYGTTWIGRTGETTGNTRDFISLYGTKVTSAGQSAVTFEIPEGQSYAEYMVGSETSEGAGITVDAGESVTLGSVSYLVEGAVSGNIPVTLPTTIAKIDSDVTDTDKSAYTLVLVGGPAVNTLVNELQTTGKLPKTIGGAGSDADVAATGAGVVEIVEDAWGDGTFAFVVAGSDRAGTNAAANILANYDDYMETLDGETSYIV